LLCQSQDSAILIAAHRAVGTSLFRLGALPAALTHLAQGIALYDPQQHRASVFFHGQDSGVLCCIFAAWALWSLGYPDQGLAQSQQAVTLAQQLAHPYSLNIALSFAVLCHTLCRETRATQERAESAITRATNQGFPSWRVRGAVRGGWALVQQGQAKEGIEQMHQGLGAHRATGAEINRSHFLALLAEAHGVQGEPERGLTALTEALPLVGTTGERWYAPELYRLKGVLLLQQSANHGTEAERCFHHALEIARHQQAKSFELRTATSLARLWQQQGKRQEASDLLAPVYGWFTEGFDTTDLQEAKALVDELSESRG